MEVLKGIPVAPGIKIGRAFVLHDPGASVPRRTITSKKVDDEIARFDKALERVEKELIEDRDRAAEKLGPEPAKIFEFHLGLLQDESLINPIRQRIRDEHVIAPYAASQGFRELARRFKAMGSEVFSEKAGDVLDLDRRVMRTLLGQGRDRLAELDQEVLLISHDLTPAQVASLDIERVQGLAIDSGGRTSHNSIVAAALGIPVVVGCKTVAREVNQNDRIIIDGNAGLVIIRPDEATLNEYQAYLEQLVGVKAGLEEMAGLEAVTRDGVAISLMGNIEFPREIDAVIANGGDGVGLYRTEFLFLTSQTEPTEEDQFDAYRRAVEMLDGRPLTIRTLDLGADKYTQDRAEEPERNPFLGLRSIRYCLQNLPLFKTQLRAVLRASAFGPIKLMFPLISTAMELRQAKMILQDTMEECEDDGIEFDADMPVGMMIEVPSAALLCSTFAREVDFFSIGTNDLIQYTLAVDRGNERVANLYSAANPAVIQLVKAVLRTSKRFNVDTSLCGEIAGESLYTMLLIGLGLRTLSLVPSQIPNIKRVVRSVDIPTCERLARKVGSFDSDRRVLNALREELQRVLPGTGGGWSVEG